MQALKNSALRLLRIKIGGSTNLPISYITGLSVTITYRYPVNELNIGAALNKVHDLEDTLKTDKHMLGLQLVTEVILGPREE